MTRNEREFLIRHHLEEASTHIGMVKKLTTDADENLGPKRNAVTLKACASIGNALRKLHHQWRSS